MSIQHAMKSGDLCRRAGVNVIYEGVHGIGKSSIVFQIHQMVRKERGQAFDSLDADTLDGHMMAKYALVPKNEYGLWSSSAANLTVEEIIGFPVRDAAVGGEVLRYLRCNNFLPPANHEGGGILHVDELNLAFPEVERAMMSIALEGRYLDYILPRDVWIVTSQNPAGGEYQSRRLNPPTLNRFCIITARTDAQETIRHFVKLGFHESIVDCITEATEDCLNPHQNKVESDIKQVPTSRSWGYVSKIMKVATPEEVKTLGLTVFTGLLGATTASTYHKFAMAQGVRTIPVEEVITDYGAKAEEYDAEKTSIAKWPETKIRQKVQNIVRRATVDVSILKLAIDSVISRMKKIHEDVRNELTERREKGSTDVKFKHTPEQKVAVLNIMAFLCDLPPDVCGLAFLNQIQDEYDTTMGLYEDSQLMEDYYTHYHVRVTKNVGEIVE
jgi:hypothetical protein